MLRLDANEAKSFGANRLAGLAKNFESYGELAELATGELRNLGDLGRLGAVFVLLLLLSDDEALDV